MPLFQQPEDGWSKIEMLLMREMVIAMYRQLKDPVDKFIMIATFECGYTQQEIQRMVEISQPAVNKRLSKAREHLKEAKRRGKL